MYRKRGEVFCGQVKQTVVCVIHNGRVRSSQAQPSCP